jgi:nicotinamide-nucleotide amidase
MSRPAVELLAIGDELLLGETVDTNSSWIARRLAAEGIAVARKTTVGDDVATIRAALAAALERSRIVICTGGLGPTPDDLTRVALSEVYGRALVVDPAWLDVLRERYRQRGIPMPDINVVQAERPEGADLLHNPRGTAPGIALSDDALGLTVLLPGVPSEMRGLMDEHVVPLLRSRLHEARPIALRLLRTAGISEALLAERIADIAASIAPLSLAFLPQMIGVDLRLTNSGGDFDASDRLLSDAVARLTERLGRLVYAHDHTDLATVVGSMLRERGLRITTAESCTGGLLAKRLTEDAGASDYLTSGFVTYANEAKQEMLGVDPAIIAGHGAVSEECARAMAEGARKEAGADVGVAITGIAGPGGGSEEKPVGTVWIAVSLAHGTTARRTVFGGDRTEIRERSAQAALVMVRYALLGGD